jgi:hypothetical protein
MNIYKHNNSIIPTTEILFTDWKDDKNKLFNFKYKNKKLKFPLIENVDQNNFKFKVVYAQDGYFLMLNDLRALTSQFDSFKVSLKIYIYLTLNYIWQKPSTFFTLERSKMKFGDRFMYLAIFNHTSLKTLFLRIRSALKHSES